jgi:hypothetical protein
MNEILIIFVSSVSIFLNLNNTCTTYIANTCVDDYTEKERLEVLNEVLNYE